MSLAWFARIERWGSQRISNGHHGSQTHHLSHDQARLAVFRYIESFYNPLRRHSSLGMQSPDEYERLITNNQKAASAA
jgi:transposase InsO family protein